MERQIRFLEEVERKLPKNKNFIRILSTQLNLSESFVRKKRKGTSSLSLPDLVFLSNFYNVSIDQFYNPDAYKKRMHYFPIDIQNVEQYTSYIIKIRDSLLEESEEEETWKICGDIPPPLAMYHYPEASVFLFYVDMFKKKKEGFVFEEFFEELANADVFDIYKEIYNRYIDTDSMEIYSMGALSYLTAVVGKLGSTQLFADPDTPVLILEQLQRMVLRMKDWVIRGRKREGRYKLYVSQKPIGNNIILCHQENEPRLCLTAMKGHGMKIIKDFHYLEFTRDFLNHMQEMHACMCFVGEEQRNTFFNDLFVGMEEAKQKLNSLNV